MKKLTLLVATILLMSLASSTHAQFSDIQKGSLDYLYKHHYIDGYDDGSFGPKKEINRAEFVTLILRSENVPLTKSQNCFPDVQVNVWYQDYVCTAKELGYVKGYEDNLFHPERPITKAEALKIMGELQKWDTLIGPDLKEGFKDLKKEEWYYKYIKGAYYAHYIDLVSNFYPNKFITREETAEILFRTILDRKMYMEIGNDLDLLSRDFFKIEAEASQKTYADFELYQNQEQAYYYEAGIDKLIQVFIKAEDGYTYALMPFHVKGLESDDYIRSMPIIFAKFDSSKNRISFDWDDNYGIAANGSGEEAEFKQADNDKITVDNFILYRDTAGSGRNFNETVEYILKQIRN